MTERRAQNGLESGAGIMEADDRQVTTIFTVQPYVIPPSAFEYYEALPSSANDEVRCDCTFTDDGNASGYSICRVPMEE